MFHLGLKNICKYPASLKATTRILINPPQRNQRSNIRVGLAICIQIIQPSEHQSRRYEADIPPSRQLDISSTRTSLQLVYGLWAPDPITRLTPASAHKFTDNVPRAPRQRLLASPKRFSRPPRVDVDPLHQATAPPTPGARTLGLRQFGHDRGTHAATAVGAVAHFLNATLRRHAAVGSPDRVRVRAGEAPDHAGKYRVAPPVGRAQVFSQRGRAAQDAHGEQADASRVDERTGARDAGEGFGVGLCKGLAGPGGEYVRFGRSRDIGAEGVCGAKDGRDAALPGESCYVKSIEGREEPVAGENVVAVGVTCIASCICIMELGSAAKGLCEGTSFDCRYHQSN